MSGDKYTATCVCPGCRGCRNGRAGSMCGRPCHENSEGRLCAECWSLLNPPLLRAAWRSRRKEAGG